MSLPFPNVPDLPGVPQVPRLPGFTVSEILTLGVDAISGALWQSAQALPTWGIYGSGANIGTAVLTPDSIIDFGARSQWQVLSFPVQQGGFASYNKVIVPSEFSVRMTRGGSQADRQSFLQQIANIAGDTNLYTILTPEWVYQNCNVTRYEVTRRGAAGAFFLDVDVYFIQVNQVTSIYQSATQNAQNPTAQPATNGGALQPAALDPQTLAAVQPVL